MRCKAITKKGLPCKNKALENGYCRVHAAMAAAETPPEVEQPDLSNEAVNEQQSQADQQTQSSNGIGHESVDKLIDRGRKLQSSALEASQQVFDTVKKSFDHVANDPVNREFLNSAREKAEKTTAQAAEWADKHVPEGVKTRVAKTLEKLQRLKF